MTGPDIPTTATDGQSESLVSALANLSHAAEAYGRTWRVRMVAVLHLMTSFTLAPLYLLPGLVLVLSATWIGLTLILPWLPNPPSVGPVPVFPWAPLAVLLAVTASPLARLACRVQHGRLGAVFGIVESQPPDPLPSNGVPRRVVGFLFGREAWTRVGRSVVAGVHALLSGALVVALVVGGGAGAAGALLGVMYALVLGSPGEVAGLLGLVVAGPLAALAGLSLAPYLVATEVMLHRALHLDAPEVRVIRRLMHVQDSRLRMVDAAEAERRRIERDLHDGAQQRLLALSMTLTRTRTQLARDPDRALELITEAQRESKEVMEELRQVARGLHPRVLTDHGLPSALPVAAGRSPVPVEVDVELEERPSHRAEGVAYYVVCEALTNVAKHASAERVAVRARRVAALAARGGFLLRVTVADDGSGGADPEGGSGLYGLWDRVDAVDGTLTVHSPAGGGTTLTADIPWEA
ncbi:histidine kinase [Nocardiopsis sp. EMB25]|uniref:sensor histidine kinase n=1 Tax=Nocardiopsis sp. EMB25 TaxID=2835867 RepID=UPI002283C37D|nr:histidine kinase [Nocardiopsis sp. EMB25]MCY9783763.1 histidine kinase [Nocardiopsis sp. EMB25]